jgi:hypothetical protein
MISVVELEKLHRHFQSLAKRAAESDICGYDGRLDVSPAPQAIRCAHTFFCTRGGIPEQSLRK